MAEGGDDFDDENHPLLEEDDYDDDALHESIQMLGHKHCRPLTK